jgi:hypothetical protein
MLWYNFLLGCPDLVPRLLVILEEKSIQRGIIVFPDAMTPSARKVSVSCLDMERPTMLTAIGHPLKGDRRDVCSIQARRVC